MGHLRCLPALSIPSAPAPAPTPTLAAACAQAAADAAASAPQVQHSIDYVGTSKAYAKIVQSQETGKKVFP